MQSWLRVLSLVALAVVWWPVGAEEAAEPMSQEDLEVEKLRLEVERLQHEAGLRHARESRQRVLGWLSALGGAVAFAGLLWTVYSGFRSMRLRTESERAIRVSRLLESLSHESRLERLGAARGIGRFAAEVVPETLGALSTEPSDDVRRSLTRVLVRAGRFGLPEVLEANRRSLSDRVSCLGQARVLYDDDHPVEALLRLPPELVRALQREHSDAHDQGRVEARRALERYRAIGKNVKALRKALKTRAEQHLRLADATARAIAELARAGLIGGASLGSLDLGATNLYGASMVGLDLSGSILSEAILRHARLDGARLEGCDLRFVDLFDGSLEYARLARVMGRKARLREVKARGIDLREADLTEALLGGASMEHARLDRGLLTGARLRRAVLRMSSAVAVDAVRVEAQQAIIDGGTWDDAVLYRGRLQEISARGTSLVRARLCGADLRGAVLVGADLTDAELAGADVSGADLTAAKLDGIDWQNVRGRDAAIGLSAEG